MNCGAKILEQKGRNKVKGTRTYKKSREGYSEVTKYGERGGLFCIGKQFKNTNTYRTQNDGLAEGVKSFFKGGCENCWAKGKNQKKNTKKET